MDVVGIWLLLRFRLWGAQIFYINRGVEGRICVGEGGFAGTIVLDNRFGLLAECLLDETGVLVVEIRLLLIGSGSESGFGWC